MKRVSRDDWTTFLSAHIARITGNSAGDYMTEWKTDDGTIVGQVVYPPAEEARYYVDDSYSADNLISHDEIEHLIGALEKLCAVYDMACGDYKGEGVPSGDLAWLAPTVMRAVEAGFRGRYVLFDCYVVHDPLDGKTFEDRRHVFYHAMQLVRLVSEERGRASASLVYVDYTYDTFAWHVFRIAKV